MKMRTGAVGVFKGLLVAVVLGVVWAAEGGKGTYIRIPSIPPNCRVDGQITTAKWGPKRTKPVFKGPVPITLVPVAFPDCVMPIPNRLLNDLNHIQGEKFTIKEYFDDYSQLTTYPVLSVCPSVYIAPKPYGFYCHWDWQNCRNGWKTREEGLARTDQLRKDALAFAHARLKGVKKNELFCIVYCNKLERRTLTSLLRDVYPTPPKGEPDPLDNYDPKIDWRDCLSVGMKPMTAFWPGNGFAILHALGHLCGAPDYHHGGEPMDGVSGDPALPWRHGPTGMAYDRCIYQAFVPPETYPTLKTNGVYTLDPRQSRIARVSGGEEVKLGYFIPSCHPNYMFYVEYVHGEYLPVGTPGVEGMLIHVINVTFSAPFMGPPDLCYTYRRDDSYMKALTTGSAYLRTGDSFTLKSNPAALIPPLIPGGIEITDIVEKNRQCSFRLTFTQPSLTSKEIKDVLLPKVRLVSVDEVLPTSMHPMCDVIYRGEPLLTEYGFVWDVKSGPTLRNSSFPLYHRDRYDARILDLMPGTTYFVRAYVKSASGVTYSDNEIKVDTPTMIDEVPPLLTDNVLGCDYIRRWYYAIDPEDHYVDSANPLIALMSLGIYYGQPPGGSVKGSRSFKMRAVHANPNVTRPVFRMEAFDSYREGMEDLIVQSGLAEKRFGKMATWQKKCAKALKIKDPKAFVPVGNVEAFNAQTDAIQAALARSEPVFLIRENRMMPDETLKIYPLDIAIIDGCNKDGVWHVVFPLGNDRGSKTKNGYYSSDVLYVSVENAVLLYYRP